MIERAAPCFDHVAKAYTQPLAASSRSRRILHHTFWVQSPHDPSLSPTWTLILELSQILRQSTTREQYRYDPPLELLHPPLSKASLCHSNNYRAKQLLTNGRRRRQRCQSQLSPAAAKYFLPWDSITNPTAKVDRPCAERKLSTAYNSNLDAKRGRPDTVEDLQAEQFEQNDELPNSEEESQQSNKLGKLPFDGSTVPTTETQDHSSPIPDELSDTEIDIPDPEVSAASEAVKLGELLKEKDDPKFDLAWQKFCQHRNPSRFNSRILAYFAMASDKVNSSRAIETYDSIEPDARTDDDFRHGMVISLRLRNRREDEIFDEALANGRAISCSRILLSHRILHEQWDRAAYTWRKISTTIGPGVLRLNALWENLDQNEKLMPRLISLANYILEKERTSGVQDSLLMDLGGMLVGRVFRSRTAFANATGEGVLSTINAVHDLGLLKPSHIFSGLLTLNTLQFSRLRTQFAFLLYRKYREFYPSDRPPRPILGLMLVILTDPENSSAEYIQVMLDDFTRFYEHPDERAYQRAMTAFACLGESDRVHELLDQYSAHYGRPNDLALLTPLLYVYAIRGDIKGTRRQFELLSQEHGFQPSLYCWNILLLAYSRARDIEGAFSTFYMMQDCQQRPNSVSFTTLMGLCAGVGDTSAVHYLVSLARKHGIEGDAPMIDTLVESYCSEDNPQGALDLLEATNEIRLDTPMTRGWNILLRYHAFKVDTGAVVSVQGRMRELGIQPDAMTYAVLMQSLALIGRTLDATKILRSLHFNRQIDANLLHYVILINGFLHEGNRKMVEVVYQEVTGRFPQRTYGVKLAKLQSLVARDITNTRFNQTDSAYINLPHAEEFLLELLNDLDGRDLANKTPQPGASFRRLGTVLSYPAAYFRFLISAYSQYGRISKFERLLDLYYSFITQETRNKSRLLIVPLELTAERLKMLMSQGRFADVTECWNHAVVQAIELGRPIDGLIVQDASKSNTIDEPTMSPPLPFYPESEEHVDHFPQRNTEDPLHELGLKILPAQRFLLAKPLHIYMRALAIQERQRELIDLITALENVGFALSSRNYNHYVQLLTRATDDDCQLHAFKTFEAKLADNLHEFSTVPVEARRYQRVAKFNMAHYVPEYRTVKFLGEVIRKFQAKAEFDGGALWRRLTMTASKTMKFLAITSRKKELTRKARRLSNRARAFRVMTRHKLAHAKSGTFVGRFRRGQYAQKPTNSAVRSTPKDLQRMRTILGGSHPEVWESAESIAAVRKVDLWSILDQASKARQIAQTAEFQKKAIAPDLVSSEEGDAYRRRHIRKSSLGKPARKGLRLQNHKLLSYANLVSRVQGHNLEGVTIKQRTGDLTLRSFLRNIPEKDDRSTSVPQDRSSRNAQRTGARSQNSSAVSQLKETTATSPEHLAIDRELKKTMDRFRMELST